VANIGFATLSIIPSFQGVGSKLSSGLAADLNGDKVGRTLGTDIDKGLGRSASQWVKTAGKAVAGIGALAGGASLVGLFKGAITEASDLGESINALNVTYGDASKGVQGLGRASAKALGLSNAEFNGLAVRFSAFTKTIAGDGGDVVGTLEDLTGRASDFASVMNLDVAEAARLFQSGLAGETEPLRQFGIDLSAAAVEAHALEVGIADSSGEMTEAQKVQARYSLLMQQTAQTAGDFADTSDSLANSQRILSAQTDDLRAKLGAALLPAMEGLVSFGLNSVVPFVERVTDLFANFSVDNLTSGVERLTGIDLGGVKSDVEALYNTITKGGSVQAEDGSWVPASFYGDGNALLDLAGDIRNYDWSSLGTTISDGLAGAGDALLDGVDVSGLFSGLREDAETAAGDIIAGFQDGVETGNWAGFGTALGGAIRLAIESIPDVGGAIFTILSNAIQTVDWAQLALDFGRIAPTIGLAFVTGLLNFDIGALFKFVGDNWFEVLLGVVTLLFAPAKLIGAIGKVLAKVPFIGTFLERSLLAFNTFGREKILPFITTFLGNIARGFIGTGGSTIGGAVTSVLGGVALRFYVWGDDLVKWFGALPGRLAAWVLDLGTKIGTGIRAMIGTIGALFRALWETSRLAFVTGVTAVLGIFLSFVGDILKGAADAFGWVPGIGDRLRTASDNFETFKRNVNGSISGITESKTVSIRAELNATADALVKAGATPAQAQQRVAQTLRARGGSVFGPGTATSDSIPAMLSNGEHVWTAKEVAMAGGHGAVEQMRREVLHRAGGGPVTRGVSVATRIPPTDDFDVLVDRLNAGSTALGDSMRGYVSGLQGAADKAAAARATVAAEMSGPVPGLSGSGWSRPGVGGRVTSEFGMRRHPIRGTMRLHNGIDVAGLSGSRVLAAQAGSVRSAGSQGSYGNVVFIRHANGDETGYAHLARIMVGAGQQVARGQQVGVEGATGGVTGKHLHFNWRRGGSFQNPRGMGVFDDGGLAVGAGLLPKATLRPERVLSPRQTESFDRLSRALDKGPLSRPQPTQPIGPIYVQNPVTGEYLMAQFDRRVDRGLRAADRRATLSAAYAGTE